jgi:pyridoxamine 5'-phosphate oxidase
VTLDLADRRRTYARAVLDEAHAVPEPMEQFRRWFAEAEATELREPNAMTLATADGSGLPSARIVLLKGVDDTGFLFFTDDRSRKGRDLVANPRAALVFHWPELERQVRVAGSAERVTDAVSAAYFHSRPRGSQLGAWASHQSERLTDRAALEARLRAVTAQYEGVEVPLPPYWGGFRIVPSEVEFWQGRPDRLHDRLLYSRTPDGAWQRARLSP